MIKMATGMEVDSPELLVDIESVTPEQIVHRVGEAKPQKRAGNSYISALKGCSGPRKYPPQCLVKDNKIVRYPETAENSKLVVINDKKDGFNSSSYHRFIQTIDPSAIIVLKTHYPLDNDTFRGVIQKKDFNRLVTVVNADDLRKIKEVHISRSLSWERTAKEFLWQLSTNPELKSFKECSHLVVLFGTDGAIIHRGNELYNETLIFDPCNLEGQFGSAMSGTIPGMTSVFVAALAAEIHNGRLAGLEKGVRHGLLAMRRLWSAGFSNDSGAISYPLSELFEFPGDKTGYTKITVPGSGKTTKADPGFWRILDQKTRNTRRKAAMDIVRFGLDKGLPDVPMGAFGKFKTIDRTEIESYSGIRNIIIEFLNDPKKSRPLSIAVFGAPGSGKSFGVTEVARNLSSDALEKLEFNVSQFQDQRDLLAAFHRIRNVVLEGKIPFVFFDEFDSSLDGEALGWLKYFLAPMQDGYFREGETNHPLGKAIFVFAGGTSHSFEKFIREDDDSDEQRKFASAKGPDFISRLRGFINILGTNPVSKDDNACIIRRAIILRDMFERSKKASGLLHANGELYIDQGLIRAFLNISRYKHGTRSMGAIIDMSSLTDCKQFSQTSLPPDHQLNLHVDAKAFFFIAEKERFRNHPDEERELVDKLTKTIHERMEADFSLASDEKYDWRSFAEDIPRKLDAINCGVRNKDESCCPQTPDITDGEIDQLVRLEHERFLQEKSLPGWRICKEPENHGAGMPVFLTDFDVLPESRKQHYRRMIENIPVALHLCGMEVFRMREFDEISDGRMIDELARIIHEDYCAKRAAEGDTPSSNPSICPFDELPRDLRDANFDNARSIPVKLSHIGYRIRKLKEGCKPSAVKFSEEEIKKLAILEHNRWNWQKRLQGWILKPGKKDIENKTTPLLVPWEQLTDKIKEYDLETVRLIPQLLTKAGFEIYKLH